ncbi:MAG: hypothetical protein GYA21_09280 [Myxococcales bacterium]|nr:hypothetical protein [Myxococcales bacterium]
MRRVALGIALLLVPALALGITVEGHDYPATVTIDGKTMKLVGAGKRKKWFVGVYTMGAYSESGKCDPKALVAADEPKYLKLKMLRDVSAEKMANTISESFKEHMPKNPSAELKKQSDVFMNYFKDECKEGTVLEFFYLPGTGTSLKQNGKELGPVLAGAEFARVLWDIYFGEDTCCSGLKEQIFECCGLKL